MRKISLLFMVASLLSSFALAENAPMDCSIGPVEREFGGTSWLVYGCTDDQSLAIATAPGSPAMPFVFFFYPQDGEMQLRGEGTGAKKATDAAFEELSALSDLELNELFEETKAESSASN